MERARLFFIDNLRILLITLIMMLHLSITYGGAGGWYYRESEPDTISFVVLTWHNGMVQAFSMGLFFLISGYFTPGSYDRKGPRRFFKDRIEPEETSFFFRSGADRLYDCYDPCYRNQRTHSLLWRPACC